MLFIVTILEDLFKYETGCEDTKYQIWPRTAQYRVYLIRQTDSTVLVLDRDSELALID